MPTYQQMRVNRWYAVLEIPKDLRHAFPATKARKDGETPKPLSRFVQSLETESRTVAARRVLPVVIAWKKQIAAAKGEPVDDDAAYWRRSLRNAGTKNTASQS